MLAYFSRGYDVIIIQSDLILRQKVRLGFFGNIPSFMTMKYDILCVIFQLLNLFSFVFFDHFHNWALACATRSIIFYLYLSLSRLSIIELI